MFIDLSIYLSMCSSINLHTVYSPISIFLLFIGNKTKQNYHITIIVSTIVLNKSHNFQLSQLPLNSTQITHIGSNSRIHWKNTPTTHGSIAGIRPYFALDMFKIICLYCCWIVIISIILIAIHHHYNLYYSHKLPLDSSTSTNYQ